MPGTKTPEVSRLLVDTMHKLTAEHPLLQGHHKRCLQGLCSAHEQRSPRSACLQSRRSAARCNRAGLCIKARAKEVWGMDSPSITLSGRKGIAHSSGNPQGKDMEGSGLHSMHRLGGVMDKNAAKMEQCGGLSRKSKVPLKARGRYSALLIADSRVGAAPGQGPQRAGVGGRGIRIHAQGHPLDRAMSDCEVMLDATASIQTLLHEISSGSRGQSEHHEAQPGQLVELPAGLTWWRKQPGLTGSVEKAPGSTGAALEKGGRTCRGGSIRGGLSGLPVTIAQNQSTMYRLTRGVVTYRKAEASGSHGELQLLLGRQQGVISGTAGVGCAPINAGAAWNYRPSMDRMTGRLN